MSTLKVSAIRDLSGSGGLDLSSGSITVNGTLTVSIININGSISGSSSQVFPSVSGQSGKFLSTNGSSMSWGQIEAGGGPKSISVYNSNSTWNKPSGIKRIWVKCTAGGGGGSGYGESGASGSHTETIVNVENITIAGSLTAGGLSFPTTNGTSGEQLTSDGAGNVTWAAAGTGGGSGSSTFTGLTDTPANMNGQAGKYLKVNAGATALEYVTLPVDPDTNTTYSQSSVADGSNVKLRLTDSSSTNDDILVTAGTNISISAVSAAGFTINSTPGATVTTSDSAPGSPNDGDLWWKSDEGRLKVYYQDADSSQWIDASPNTGGGSGGGDSTNTRVFQGTSPPPDPQENDLWFDSDQGN